MVAALAALGISAVVVAVIMQMISEQNKSLKYYMQKSDVIELKNMLVQQLSLSSSCDWQFQTFTESPKPAIDVSTPAHLAAQVVPINKIYAGDNTASLVLVDTATTLSGLKVASIALKNLVATGGTDEYSGDVEISFDAATMTRSIAPLKIKRYVLLNPATKRIAGCSNGASGSAGLTSIVGLCSTNHLVSVTNGLQTVCCVPTGQTAMSVTAPGDNSWKVGIGNKVAGGVIVPDENCSTVQDVGGGNPINLKCCK